MNNLTKSEYLCNQKVGQKGCVLELTFFIFYEPVRLELTTLKNKL